MTGKHALSMFLTLAIATLGWVLTDRYVLRRPWPQVRHAAVAVAAGFLAVHLLMHRLEHHKRDGHEKEEHRK
jgi:hypothetical protein